MLIADVELFFAHIVHMFATCTEQNTIQQDSGKGTLCANEMNS